MLCLINFPKFSESKEILKIGRSQVCVLGGGAKGWTTKLSSSVYLSIYGIWKIWWLINMVGERYGGWKLWWVKDVVGEKYGGWKIWWVKDMLVKAMLAKKNTVRTITVGEPIQWVNMYVGEHVCGWTITVDERYGGLTITVGEIYGGWTIKVGKHD